MANQKIFISYSRSDSAEVIKLATRLKQAGADLWLDQLDIPVGAVWDIEIEKALGNCECLIYIVSQASVASNNVLNEVYYALEDNKRVLPVKINDCKIPFRIRRLQYIDLFQDPEKGFQQLLESLQLGEAPTAPAPEGPEKDQELLTWQRTLAANTLAGYQTYLQAYPDGRFKDDAIAGEQQINQAIIAKAGKAKEEKEQAEWLKATEFNTARAFENYLDQFPSGKYAVQARQFIEQLKRKTAAPTTAPSSKPHQEAGAAGGSNNPYRQTATGSPATETRKFDPVAIWSVVGLVVLIIIFVVMNKSGRDTVATDASSADTVAAFNPATADSMARVSMDSTIDIKVADTMKK